MSNNSTSHQENMQEGRESLSFLANIATGHYFNNAFPSNLSGQQQGTAMDQQAGSSVGAGSNASSASNAALSQYHMGGLQTTPSTPASNPSIATSTHFTNPALTTQNCTANPAVVGQQYLATSMSSMALNFSQGMNAMHQNTAANLSNVASGLGSMSLPSVPGGSVCFQQNLSPHVAPFPLQVPPLQIPSPLRHPTLLQHQLLHHQQQQQQQAVTSQQSLMQSSLQQHNALQPSIIPEQTAFMHQTSLLSQSSQSPTLQQTSQQVKQSSHPSSAAQQPPPVHQQSQSPGEQPPPSSHQQSLLQASKSGKLPHLPPSLSNCPPANSSFRPASKIETSSSSAAMESSAVVPGSSVLNNCNNRNTTNSSLVTGPVTTSNTSTNAVGRHPSSTMSEANQCSEMFNTIREALSVADNNPEVSSAASIFSEEPTYLNPSSCSLSEAASNQLLAFNFLTTSPYQLMCRHCGFTTDFHMVFTRHMACHYADKGYECPLCTAVCSSEEFLKRHVNEHLEGRMNATAKNLSGNVSAESGGKAAALSNLAASFKDNNAAARYADSQAKNQAVFSSTNDGSSKHIVCSGGKSNAGMNINKSAKNTGSVSGKKNSPKNNHNSQKTASLSTLKGMKRKKTTDDSENKKSRPMKSSVSKDKRKNSPELSESGGDTSDESYSVNEGSSYSINKYHGPPLAHPNGPYNSKLQANPKLNPSSTPGDEDFDLYNPIDPIATTNRTLSYTDFYKKHSFMNVNSSMKCDGTSPAMHGGNNNASSNSFNSAVLDASNMNSINHHHGLPFHTNNYGAATASNAAKMKDPCNNYTIEQLSGHPAAAPGFMGSHNINQPMYGNNNNNSSSSNANNFQSEPLSLIVNTRTAGVGSEAPPPQATARRAITTCRVGCSHFGRTLPGEVGPATASANNNSSCAVSGSIANSLNNINTNVNTNGTSSSSAYTLPNNGFNVSTPQSYNNATNANNTNSRNSLNPERQEGSSSASEHITVKIDPFDVAPSMLGAARHHHMNKQHPTPSTCLATLLSEDASSYHSKQMTGTRDNAVNFDAACFESLGSSDQNNGINNNLVTLPVSTSNTDSNLLTLGASQNQHDDCKKGKKKMAVLSHLVSPESSPEGGVVDSSVYVSKTHTAKYSVNYAISDKTRSLLGSPLGGWNASRNSTAGSASRKNRKPRDYYNRGRGYYGGRSRSGRPPYGLGSKLAPAASSLGEPCSVEDIIDYTVGAGLKLMIIQTMTGGGNAGLESSVGNCQYKASLTNDLTVQLQPSEGSVDVTDQVCLETHHDDDGGMLTPLAAYDNVDNTSNSVPLHFLHDNKGAGIAEKDEEPTVVTTGMAGSSDSSNRTVNNAAHISDGNNFAAESRDSFTCNGRDHTEGTSTSSRGECTVVKLEASNSRDGDGCNSSSAALEIEDASKLLLAAVGLVAAGGRDSETGASGDDAVVRQHEAGNATTSEDPPSLLLENATGSLGNSEGIQATEDDKINQSCTVKEKDAITKDDKTNMAEMTDVGSSAVAIDGECGDGQNNNAGDNINSSCTCNNTSTVCNTCSINSTTSTLDSNSNISPTNNSSMDSVDIKSSIIPITSISDPATSVDSVHPSTSSIPPASSSSMDPTTSSTPANLITSCSSTNPASSISSTPASSSLLSTTDLYLCRICGFETHYQLVLARHAPSHHKKDGVIL